MRLDEVYAVSTKREIISKEEIRRFETELGVKLPDGFEEFLIKFGPGEFCGCLSMFAPSTLLKGQALYQQMYSGTFFWDAGESALCQQEVLEAVWLARGLDGDEVVYFPRKSPGLFLLPRNRDVIKPLGSTCEDVLESFGSSGLIYQPSQLKWFCTFKDRCRLRWATDNDLDHADILSLVQTAFGAEHVEVDQDNEFSIFFCPRILGFIQVYSGSLDIRYDIDFDAEVCRTADQVFGSHGFSLAEHFVPTRD